MGVTCKQIVADDLLEMVTRRKTSFDVDPKYDENCWMHPYILLVSVGTALQYACQIGIYPIMIYIGQ